MIRLEDLQRDQSLDGVEPDRVPPTEGDSEAGRLLAPIKGQTEAIRQLGYRLYTLCERRGQAEDARGYNELITSWTAVETAANTAPDRHGQTSMDF